MTRADVSSDQLAILVETTNGGQRIIRPGGEIRVRAESGEALSFPFNEGRGPVLPGARRIFQQQVGPVPGGELSVEVVIDVSPRGRHRERLVVPATSPSSDSPAS